MLLWTGVYSTLISETVCPGPNKKPFYCFYNYPLPTTPSHTALLHTPLKRHLLFGSITTCPRYISGLFFHPWRATCGFACPAFFPLLLVKLLSSLPLRKPALLWPQSLTPATDFRRWFWENLWKLFIINCSFCIYLPTLPSSSLMEFPGCPQSVLCLWKALLANHLLYWPLWEACLLLYCLTPGLVASLTCHLAPPSCLRAIFAFTWTPCLPHPTPLGCTPLGHRSHVSYLSVTHSM